MTVIIQKKETAVEAVKLLAYVCYKKAQIMPARGIYLNKKIILANKITTENGFTNLDKAVKTNDLESQKMIIGTLQHEEGHYMHNHIMKQRIFNAIVPPLITFTAALGCRKLLPLNSMGRFFTKVAGGLLLVPINAFATTYVSRKHEFQADQNVSPEYQSAHIDYLKRLDKKRELMTRAALKQVRLNKEQIDYIIEVGNYIDPFFATHPTGYERAKRLQTPPLSATMHYLKQAVHAQANTPTA